MSICIPTFNGAAFIEKTINSIRDSSQTDMEIIISDDASQDNTIEIINNLNDPRIKIFQNSQTLGPVKNWNCALKRASGEFLGLLNHDDLFGPFWLTYAVYILKKYPRIGWITTACQIVDENGRIVDVFSAFPETREYTPREVFPVVARLNGLGPGFIARKSILEEVGYYDEDAGPSADNDLFLRLAWQYPMYYSNYPHTAWRLHHSNLTHRWHVVDQCFESLKILNKVFSDPLLPDDFLAFRESAYNNLYSKITQKRLECLEFEDEESACKLMGILSKFGYKQDLSASIA